MQSSGEERFNCVMGDDKEDRGDEGVLSGWFIVPSRCSTMEDESGLTVGGESDTVIGDSARTDISTAYSLCTFLLKYIVTHALFYHKV